MRDGDYRAFLQAMGDALRVVPMRILGWCLMPNHWHLALWPRDDGDLSRYVGWVSNTHVRRHNRFHGLDGQGHLYQGRCKSFPVQEDGHLLCVGRYVEANALRAGLVPRGGLAVVQPARPRGGPRLGRHRGPAAERVAGDPPGGLGGTGERRPPRPSRPRGCASAWTAADPADTERGWSGRSRASACRTLSAARDGRRGARLDRGRT